MGMFIPVPGVSPEILDSSCYSLFTAKAVAKVFHLEGGSGKQAESRQPEGKLPVFAPLEGLSPFTRAQTCQEL